jgi:tetrahydromethanopterin S-methyltransferase subunit E
MNRVWKYFLKSLAKPLAGLSYILVVVLSGVWVEQYYIGAGALSISIFIVMPLMVLLLRDMWRDAKEKVERENKEMMRTLKGSDYK